jgi:hypothetical protein
MDEPADKARTKLHFLSESLSDVLSWILNGLVVTALTLASATDMGVADQRGRVRNLLANLSAPISHPSPPRHDDRSHLPWPTAPCNAQ